MKSKYVNMALLCALITAWLGCSTGAPAPEVEADEATTTPCESEYTYGGRLLCMPSYPEYTACFADTVVSRRFKPLNHGNIVLELYMRPAMLDSLRANPGMPVSDYHRVWVFRKKWEYFANDAAIAEAEAAWFEELKQAPRINLSDQAGVDAIAGTTLVEVYRPRDYMATAVYVVRLPADEGAGLSVMTYSTLALRTKLVFANYYLPYTGPGSVREAKQQAEAFGRALLDANQ
jgi:hypothetical protein